MVFGQWAVTRKSYNTNLSLSYCVATIRDVAKNLEPDCYCCYFALFIVLLLLKFIQLFGYPAASV